MEKRQAITFHMDRIRIEQFAILAETIPCDKTKTRLGTMCQFQVSPKDCVVASSMKFSFEDGDKPFMLLAVQCVFVIDSKDWNGLRQENGNTILPKGLLRHMAMHTVGTSRGILHCKTESTPFNCYIIPPINVENMVQDDIIIPKEQ